MSEAALSLVVGAKALDALTMRMSAIAWNIANVNSPRFQALKVDFETALSRAAAHGPEAIEAMQLRYSAGRAFGPSEDRRMDLMISDAAQTAMRYSALVDMLGRRMALTSAAIGGQG